MVFVLDGRYIQDHFPGIGRYVYNLVEALARAAPQHRFRVLYDPRGRNTRYGLGELSRWENVELLEVNAPVLSPRAQLLGRNRAVMEGARLWHSAYYIMPYLPPIPVVVTLEDVTPLLLPAEMASPLKRLAYRLLNRLAAARAARIITISHAACEDIRRVLGLPASKLEVVPLAADRIFQPLSSAEIERVRESLALPDRYLLYAGSNQRHKNLGALTRAFARAGTVASLVLAGHWDARYDGAAKALEAGEQTRILFRHNVSNRDLPGLIGGALAFVFPSLHEGFGLPPLEAMACGTPVACSDIPSLRETAGEAALLFDPRDTEQIAAALARLDQDAALREDLRGKGLIQAAKFNWERTAEETLRVYARATGDITG